MNLQAMCCCKRSCVLIYQPFIFSMCKHAIKHKVYIYICINYKLLQHGLSPEAGAEVDKTCSGSGSDFGSDLLFLAVVLILTVIC